MSVSKTWVAVAVRRHRLAITERRAEWKRSIPPPCPVNHVRAIDLTAKTDLGGETHPILGIRHQRTELHCPWQSGRVERFFGTLKEKLDRWAAFDLEQLTLALADFRAWYNHVRPHQHLGGRTPAEAWTGIDPYESAPKEVRYFAAWDGMLSGYWMRR